MSNAVVSEVDAYCHALNHHVEHFVSEHWDWKGLPLSEFAKLNAGLLAMAWQQEEPAGCRLLTLPPGAVDEVNWAHVAALDAYLRTQKAATPAAGAILSTLKIGDLVYCDAPEGNGWVAEITQLAGDKLRVKGLLDSRRETAASACRRVILNPYQGKNILGEFFSMKFLEWQLRIGAGVAQGRRILRQAQGFPQPNGALAIIVTDTRPRTLERLFEELPFLPAVYGAGTNDVCFALPFAHRILLASSVKDARQLSLKIRQTSPNAAVPHLYVEGRTRYQHLMAELANEHAQDEWASVTLLGAEPEEEATSYARWRWSAEELDYFFNRHRSAEEPEKVRLKLTAVRFFAPADASPTEAPFDSVAQLQGIVTEIVTLLNALADGADGSPAVNPRPVYYFLNAYLRHVMAPGQECTRAAAWLQSQHERTRAYLLGQENEDEALGEQFADAFYEAGFFSNRRIEKAATELESAFAKLNDFFHTDSPKHRHLTSSLKKSYHDNPAGGRYVLADRDTYEAVRATYHDPEKLVSVLRLHDNEGKIPSFQRIMRSAELNSTQAHFLVPFIFNREQYDTMSWARGQVKLFLYEQIEDGKFDNVRRAAERRDEVRLLESSRRRFCDQSYEDLVALTHSKATTKAAGPAADTATLTGKAAFGKISQDDFFTQLYALDETGYARETQDRVIESRPYSIRFTTGEQDMMEGSKSVLRQEDGGYVWRRISELMPGDAVLFYENEDRNLNYQILLARDETKVMARIEHYSSLWKRTLRQLERLKINEHVLFRDLKQHGFPVAILSLHQYLQGTIRFPMHEASLRAIQALARAEGLADCALCEEDEFRALLAHRAKYQTLSKLLGRGLSDELLRHHVTEQRGPLLAALDDSVVTVLSRSIKSRTIAAVQPNKA